jgi:hypothetical protein
MRFFVFPLVALQLILNCWADGDEGWKCSSGHEKDNKKYGFGVNCYTYISNCRMFSLSNSETCFFQIFENLKFLIHNVVSMPREELILPLETALPLV